MEERTLKALEFDKILDSVAAFASSEPARAAVREIRPFDNIDYVRELIDEVEEADKIAFEYATNLSFAFDNIDFVLDKAAVMSVLSMGELLRVSRMLRVARNVRTGIAKVPDENLRLLKRIATSLYIDKNLEDEIDNERRRLVQTHIQRLNEGKCQPQNSSVFINLVGNLERAADHITYIAHSIEQNQ